MILSGGFVATAIFAVFGVAPIGIPLVSLGLVVSFGVLLDPVYSVAQGRRWDHDWPPLLFFISSFVEFLVLLAALYSLFPKELLSLAIISAHYWLTWLIGMIAIFHFVNIVKPTYRYSGGVVAGKQQILARIETTRTEKT
jgi:hypothetical protein